METVLSSESTIPYNLTESWARNLTILNDSPLSAAFFKLEDKTGEAYLDELPELQLNSAEFVKNVN